VSRASVAERAVASSFPRFPSAALADAGRNQGVYARTLSNRLALETSPRCQRKADAPHCGRRAVRAPAPRDLSKVTEGSDIHVAWGAL
jgi:hypothetical protein